MATSNMLAEAGMTSDELWRVVLSQAGDKPSESVAGVPNGTVEQAGESVTGGTNVPVLQDAPSEAEENKPTAKLREVSQDQEPKLVLETVQGATAEAQLSLF
jgi:hypothetical protein